jgi:hypothetical protein
MITAETDYGVGSSRHNPATRVGHPAALHRLRTDRLAKK